MSKEPEDTVLPRRKLVELATQADEASRELSALAGWLLSFPDEDDMEPLRFLYATCGSIATSTATMRRLDYLLMAPDEHPWQYVPDCEASLLVSLIEWRLDRMRQTPAYHDLVPRLRELLSAFAYAGTPVVEVVEHPIDAPLLRLADQAAFRVNELAALVSWLVPRTPVTDLRELEAMKEMTGSYRAALAAIQGLDALLTTDWHSLRDCVTGDLSTVLLFIEYRMTTRRGDRKRLEEIKRLLVGEQRRERMAAAHTSTPRARRRRLQPG